MTASDRDAHLCRGLSSDDLCLPMAEATELRHRQRRSVAEREDLRMRSVPHPSIGEGEAALVGDRQVDEERVRDSVRQHECDLCFEARPRGELETTGMEGADVLGR